MSAEERGRGWDECNAQWAARGLTPDFANPYAMDPTEVALSRLATAIEECGDLETFDVVVELLEEAWGRGLASCRSKHLTAEEMPENPFAVVRRNNDRSDW